MALIRADRVEELTSTTGLSDFALRGAVTGSRGFAAVMAEGDTCYYACVAVNAAGMPTGDWETGLGTLTGETLARTTVHASSTGSKVAFAVGRKRLVLTATAYDVNVMAGNANVMHFGADPTGVADSAPAFRAARDFLAGIGGGIISVPSGSQFRFSSTETIDVWDIGGATTKTTPLALPAGVSLIGAGSSTSKIFAPAGGISGGIVSLLDPSNQKVAGLELEGPGGDGNTMHGIFTFPETSFAHVMTNVKFDDLYIHDVGSYGLSNQLLCQGVTVSKIKTRSTGADGVDWKIRGDALPDLVADAVFFSDIDIASYGQRAGAGTPTGAGFRGRVHVDRISVKDIPNAMPGIQFVPGIVSADDIRLSASLSTITNWYVEGADPKADAIGLEVSACAGVRVGVGVAKYARCQASDVTATPYGFDDGGLFEGATVIPAHGRTAFQCDVKSTHFRGVRVISDKVYFDAKRGNLTAGQTVFPLPWASTTNNSAGRFVVKVTAGGVRTILTETTDYSWTTNSFTLVSGVAADDRIFAVFAPQRGFRVTAVNCSVMGVQDYFVPSRISVSSQAIADACEFHIMWEGRGNVGQLNSDSVTALVARDPTVTDKGLTFQAQAGGAVVIGANANKVSFFSGGSAVKQTVTGAKGGNAALGSLLTALAAYGFIADSSSA